MAKYRPVDLRLWSDRKFLSLSDDGRMLWLYYLTSPATNSIPGVIVGGQAALSEQLGWSVARLQKGVGELLTKGLSVRFDGRVTWLPNALRYQKISGPNAVIGMSKVWDDVPECELKSEIWEALKIACKSWSRIFADLFPEPLAKGVVEPLPNQFDTGSGSGTGSGKREEAGANAPVLALAEPENTRPDPVAEFANAAIAEINRLARRNYQANTDETLKNSKALTQANHTPEDAQLVVRSKRAWLTDDKMRAQFKPSVLLRPSNFKRYLAEDVREQDRRTVVPVAAPAQVDTFELPELPWVPAKAAS